MDRKVKRRTPKKFTFNRKINTFYKLTQRERKKMLVQTLIKSSEEFSRLFERKIGKKEQYQHYFKEQDVKVREALISGFMSAKFRGKLGVEYKIIKMARSGAKASDIIGYIKSKLGLKNVKTNLDNKDKILQLTQYSIVYTGSTSKSSNSVRLLYFKDLTQAGKVIVIPDSLFQRMSIDDILIEFGRVSGKRNIETTEDIPIIYTATKRGK